MRFVMVTGMSGGGKSTAMRLLEDMGYYCVDNLPIQLIDKFVELLSTPNTEITKVAKMCIRDRTLQRCAERIRISFMKMWRFRKSISVKSAFEP